MSRDTHQYIVKFTPNATKATAHHIILYGCKIPGIRERDSRGLFGVAVKWPENRRRTCIPLRFVSLVSKMGLVFV